MVPTSKGIFFGGKRKRGWGEASEGKGNEADLFSLFSFVSSFFLFHTASTALVTCVTNIISQPRYVVVSVLLPSLSHPVYVHAHSYCSRYLVHREKVRSSLVSTLFSQALETQVTSFLLSLF